MGVKSKYGSVKKAIVERYLAGDKVAALSKEYGVSRPAVYNWIKEYKDEIVNRSRTANMSAADLEHADKRDLRIEVRALTKTVDYLKHKIFDLMVETGSI